MAAATAARKAFSRLPKALKPLEYRIRLKPDLKAFTFKGWMYLEMDVVQETNKIVLNAAELEISKLCVNDIKVKTGSSEFLTRLRLWYN